MIKVGVEIMKEVNMCTSVKISNNKVFTKFWQYTQFKIQVISNTL